MELMFACLYNIPLYVVVVVVVVLYVSHHPMNESFTHVHREREIEIEFDSKLSHHIKT